MQAPDDNFDRQQHSERGSFYTATILQCLKLGFSVTMDLAEHNYTGISQHSFSSAVLQT